jgi:hypothetical protein
MTNYHVRQRIQGQVYMTSKDLNVLREVFGKCTVTQLWQIEQQIEGEIKRRTARERWE